MKSSETTLAERGTTSPSVSRPGTWPTCAPNYAAAVLKIGPPDGAQREPALFVAAVDGHANLSTAGSSRPPKEDRSGQIWPLLVPRMFPISGPGPENLL